MAINTKLLYDEDGFCRLCSLHDGDHQDECPGSILHKLRYEITYRGRNCTRGCCGGTSGSNTGETLMDAVRATAGDVSECAYFSADARIVYELDDDAHSLVAAEMKRVAEAKKAEEDAEEAREALRSNTEAFTWAVQSLEAERGDLTPEAFTRRMRELRDRYKALGVVFSDPVDVIVEVEDDPMPPRTPEEIEQHADAYFRLGNRAVPPWEAREKAWHERHRKA